jgi:hypothetical protein
MIQQSHYWVHIQGNESSKLRRHLHPMFIAALFTVAKEWRQPKCSHVLNGILFRQEKRIESCHCNNTDGTGAHYVK